MRHAFFLIFILAWAVFSGCSSTQINDTTETIANDVKDFGDKVTEQRK